MPYLTPAQVNDSQSSHPVIVFRVNLVAIDKISESLPTRTTLAGNEETSETDNMNDSRTIYLPGLTGNIEGIGPSGFLKHGDTFTVKGQKATYLKNNYVLGRSGVEAGFGPNHHGVNDVLQIVE